jgi:hemerythrin-like domain-containing protein
MLRDPRLIPLSHDHQHALALCVLVERALAGGESPVVADAQARRIVEAFDLEIRDHFDFEERVLFPALAAVPQVRGLVAELKTEHQALAAMVEELCSASGRPVIRKFCPMLREHVRKEEQLLFEEAQRALSREELDRIGRERCG